MHRKGQHRQVWVAGAQVLDQLDAAAIVQRDIDDRNVRGASVHRIQSLARARGFGDDVEVVLLVDQLREALSDDRVIVDQQHGTFSSRHFGSMRCHDSLTCLRHGAMQVTRMFSVAKAAVGRCT